MKLKKDYNNIIPITRSVINAITIGKSLISSIIQASASYKL